MVHRVTRKTYIVHSPITDDAVTPRCDSPCIEARDHLVADVGYLNEAMLQQSYTRVPTVLCLQSSVMR